VILSKAKDPLFTLHTHSSHWSYFMSGKGFTVNKNWDNPIEHPMPAEARVPAGFRIGTVDVAPATVLAPMVGVTDTAFRRFIRNASQFTTSAGDSASVEDTVTNQQSGCGLLMTEFTSADGLARMRESKRKRYLTFYDDEHPIGAQLFGSNAQTLAEAARIVEDTGFDTIDLNLGCPAKRVVGCNGGSGLLRDLPKIGEIFREIRKSVSIPFTVKFRLGWNDASIICVELAKMAQEEGLCAVALHARTREQGYTGQARWEWIAAVKDAVTIPVIGNGDIRTPEDAAAMVAQTNCDAVMIGRAAPSNPWIFRQIAEYTATGSYTRPTEQDRYRMIRTYFQMLIEDAEASQSLPRDARHGETGAPADRSSSAGKETAGKMKQFASWFTHGVAGGSKLRQQIFQSKTGTAVLQAVDDFFEARLDSNEAATKDEPADVELVESGLIYCD
jgi:nifR3 family TIM-barrel protein